MPSLPPPPYTPHDTQTASGDDEEDELWRMLDALEISPARRPSTPPRSAPVRTVVLQRLLARPPAEAVAETQGVSGASPRRIVPKSKPRTKKGGYAVFCGRGIGAFKHWNEEVVDLVVRVPNSLFQGYRTLAQAQAAFDYAHARGWTRVIHEDGTVSTTISWPPTPDTHHQGPAPNPLHVEGSGPFWYVVYSGIHPGIYASSLECSLNTLGLSSAAFEACATRAQAVSLFDAAVAEGRVRHIYPTLK
ncbi:hypothetical protein B0H16DRAFT_1752990 [Mycena metata]|uniref:Ribonuclease H1 N-terminal domain-containing protein n=1 Tax=Mycena metata TaxID=1033252 RepID=A0AAD7DDR5_9AGAR|nr:hypothetical protein B0H16DRAFT_1752990 [Mycena metata]